MTDQELLELFTRILRDLLGDDSIVLTMQTRTRTTCRTGTRSTTSTSSWRSRWSSASSFGIADVESFANVGDIVSEARRLLG